MKRLLSAIGAVLAVVLLAALPDMVSTGEGQVTFRLSALFSDAGGYIRGVFNGQSFLYHTSDYYGRPLLVDLWQPFVTSLRYAAIAAAAALFLGTLGGMLVVAWRRENLKDVVSVVGVVPDFVLVLVLQVAVVAVYKATGFRIARIATITRDQAALLLPLLILTLLPAVFVLRSVSNRTYMLTTEDYVRVARAQGLSRFTIYRRHLAPNVLLGLRADLHKIVAMLLSNLFIVEYLFNVRGITYMVFYYGGRGDGYQFNLVLTSFFGVLLLYALIYSGLRLMLWLAFRATARG
jgi:peptide/nickel transport system permease protein